MANVRTMCAICETEGESTEVYPERLDGEIIDAHAYSARRFDGKIGHFRIVQCSRCGLLRSDPIIEHSKIEHLYTESSFTYEGLVQNLKKTYGWYVKKAEGYLNTEVGPPEYPRTDLKNPKPSTYSLAPKTLLDVGCGNGFILTESLKLGFDKVAGIEPSRKAIEGSDPSVRAFIKQGIFDNQSFPSGSFDIVTFFQVMEHFTDPLNFLRNTEIILKKGGLVLAFNHNMDALAIKLMGERSPVIDLEHLYFFDRKTMRKIFEKAGFEVLEQGRAWNYHSFGYLASLLGFKIKSNLTFHLPIGNQYLIARKK